jgi:signal transduction histidine kinase
MILIVDDKPENLFSLKTILELNGFQTDTASSGEEALKRVLKQDYALIILDVQMPGMDGFEVAEAITGYTRTRDIPIIFLSAVNTHKRFVTKGFASGAVDYITKPVDPDILILKVRNFYQLFEKTKALQEAERALKGTVAELHSTLETLPHIAFTANAGGQIDFVNQHWFTYSSSPESFPLTPEGEPSLEQQWPALLSAGEQQEVEIRIQHRGEGTYHYHLLRITPVRVQGMVVKWTGTFTNIHEQKMLSEMLERRVEERTHELLQMNRELELSNHDLQQFASVASHDLKEPLRKIQFFGSLIHDSGSLGEKEAVYLQKILKSSERMSRLISDLLSFTRLSGEAIFEETDLNTLVDEILSDLELVISEKKAVVRVAPLPSIQVIPGLMRQLFLNIIGNALKFARQDVPPEVTIVADRTMNPFEEGPSSEEGVYCRLRIQDNGIGFDEKYTGKIFTLFQRLNPREQFEGTGIGLAIAKKIVDKHHGFIAARSTPGEGATFIITLPLQQPAAPGEYPSSSPLLNHQQS